MARGTPILGTPVRLMADTITDGETGFIMKNNTLQCRAENARALVAREFTYDRAVETYRPILLEDLLHSR